MLFWLFLLSLSWLSDYNLCLFLTGLSLKNKQTDLKAFIISAGFDFLLNELVEKEMAAHSSVLAWRIPRTGDPGGLPSMGSHRVGHD